MSGLEPLLPVQPSSLEPRPSNLEPAPTKPAPPSPPPPARSSDSVFSSSLYFSFAAAASPRSSCSICPSASSACAPANSPDTASAETHTVPPRPSDSSHRAVRAPAPPATPPQHSRQQPHARLPDPHDRSRDTHPSPAYSPPASAPHPASPLTRRALVPPAPTATVPPPSSPVGCVSPTRYPRAGRTRRSASWQHNSTRQRIPRTAATAFVSPGTYQSQFKSPHPATLCENPPGTPRDTPAPSARTVSR